MNKCILIGKILSDVDFQFLCNKKHVSIATIKVELCDKTPIDVYGIDLMADHMYRELNKGDVVIVYGCIRQNKQNVKIEVTEIEKFEQKID